MGDAINRGGISADTGASGYIKKKQEVLYSCVKLIITFRLDPPSKEAEDNIRRRVKAKYRLIRTEREKNIADLKKIIQ